MPLACRLIPTTQSGEIDYRFLASTGIQFAFTLLHGTFYFFYVKIFLNVYQVEEAWFHISQTIFLIWNALNDPLIGYLLNNPNWRCFRERRIPVLVGGPLYALCYLIPWFPWGSYGHGVNATMCGIQLLVSLCLYDTLFSYLGLTACCLTTEMYVTYQERMTMKWYSSLAVLFGGFSIPLVNYVSNNLQDMAAFRVTSCILAVLASITLWYCGLTAVTAYEKRKGDSRLPETSSSLLVTEVMDMEPAKSPGCNRMDGKSCRLSTSMSAFDEEMAQKLGEERPPPVRITDNLTMTRLVLCSRDFQSFVWTNFLQNFHMTFWGSFTNIVVEHVASTYSSPTFNSIYYWILEICPTLLFLTHVNRMFAERGYYHLIMWIYRFKIMAALLLLLIGPRPSIFLIFLFQDCLLASLVSRMTDVLMSDITEKIMDENRLSVPQSSVLVGLNALITKPAQSLCPMMAVWVLNRWGNYQEHIRVKSTAGNTPAHAEADIQLQTVMFYLSCSIPLIIGVLQCLIWSRFTIRR